LLFFLGAHVALLGDELLSPKHAYSWSLEVGYGIGAVLAFLLSDEANRIAFFIVLWLLWTRIVRHALSYPALSVYRTKSALLFVGLLPTFMIVFYGVGRDEAYSLLKGPHKPEEMYELRLKDQIVTRNVVVVRLIEKGAIVFDPAHKIVEFHRQENIIRLQKPALKWDPRSFVCWLWGWACGSKT